MSQELENAHSQWLAQLSSMRKAIAELQLDKSFGAGQEYGHDIVLLDDELTGGSSSDDIWDVISEEEDYEYSSDSLEVPESPSNGITDGMGRGVEWLRSRTTSLANQKSGLDANELQEQIIALLVADSSGVSLGLHIIGITNLV